MRQVPEKTISRTPRYAVLGNGRLAAHWRHYLTLLGHSVVCWSRDGDPAANCFSHIPDAEERLAATLAEADVALVLISDHAIASFVSKHAGGHDTAGQPPAWVHCAASVDIPAAFCAHPLMTFSHRLYALTHYQAIYFACDDPHRFRHLFPALSNPVFAMSAELRTHYHALCAMIGNFPQILWQQCQAELIRLGVPTGAIEPYLHQVLANFLDSPHTALTGPLTRGDDATIARHRQSLQNSPPLAALYDAFVTFYRQASETASLPDPALTRSPHVHS